MSLGQARQYLEDIESKRNRIEEVFGRSDVDRKGFENSYQALSEFLPILQGNITEFKTAIAKIEDLLKKNPEAGDPALQKKGANCFQSSIEKPQPLA
jgi:hypothetical protein